MVPDNSHKVGHLGRVLVPFKIAIEIILGFTERMHRLYHIECVAHFNFTVAKQFSAIAEAVIQRECSGQIL